MPSVQANDSMRTWGSRYARLVLEKCDKNKRQACDALGISYHTLNAYLNYQPRDGDATRAAAVPAAPAGLGASTIEADASSP